MQVSKVFCAVRRLPFFSPVPFRLCVSSVTHKSIFWLLIARIISHRAYCSPTCFFLIRWTKITILVLGSWNIARCDRIYGHDFIGTVVNKHIVVQDSFVLESRIGIVHMPKVRTPIFTGISWYCNLILPQFTCPLPDRDDLVVKLRTSLNNEYQLVFIFIPPFKLCVYDMICLFTHAM